MLSTNTWQRKFGQLLKFWSFSHGDERTWTQHHLLCKDSAVAYFIACILIAQLLGGHRMIPHYNFFLKKVSRDMWCTIPWWWMIVREAGQVREKAGWVPWDSGSVDGVRPTRAYFRQPHKWGVRESPLPFLRTGGKRAHTRLSLWALPHRLVKSVQASWDARSLTGWCLPVFCRVMPRDAMLQLATQGTIGSNPVAAKVGVQLGSQDGRGCSKLWISVWSPLTSQLLAVSHPGSNPVASQGSTFSCGASQGST